VDLPLREKSQTSADCGDSRRRLGGDASPHRGRRRTERRSRYVRRPAPCRRHESHLPEGEGAPRAATDPSGTDSVSISIPEGSQPLRKLAPVWHPSGVRPFDTHHPGCRFARPGATGCEAFGFFPNFDRKYRPHPGRPRTRPGRGNSRRRLGGDASPHRGRRRVDRPSRSVRRPKVGRTVPVSRRLQVERPNSRRLRQFGNVPDRRDGPLHRFDGDG